MAITREQIVILGDGSTVDRMSVQGGEVADMVGDNDERLALNLNRVEADLAEIELTPGPEGPQGPQGEPGPQGETGPAGPGLPAGGATGQLAAKASAADYDIAWVDPAGGHDPLSLDPQASNGLLLDSAQQQLGLGLATSGGAGAMSPGDKSKLDGLEAGAQVNAVSSVAGRTGDVALAIADISGLDGELQSLSQDIATVDDALDTHLSASNPHGIDYLDLGVGGLADATTFLRGDGTWAAPTSEGGGGTTDHAALSNLDYASSGHTGFAGTGVVNTFTDRQVVQGRIDAVNVATGREIRIDPANGALDSINSSLNLNRFTDRAVGIGTSGGAKLRAGRNASNPFTTPYFEVGDSANIPQLNIEFTPATQTQPVFTVSADGGAIGDRAAIWPDGNLTLAGRVTVGQSGPPSPANGTACLWPANGSGTKDGVAYDAGDVLLTSVTTSGASNTVILLHHDGLNGGGGQGGL